MLVLHGFYRFFPKLVAYRNDYCLSCDAPRLALQRRTVDFFHLFFLPLLPLGVWWRWHCATCGRDPHTTYQTRKAFKWIGTALLALVALSMWTVPPGTGEDVVVVWTMRLGFPVAFVFALRATLRPTIETQLADKLRDIPPTTGSVCPLCKSTLLPEEPFWRCSKCGVSRRSLPAV